MRPKRTFTVVVERNEEGNYLSSFPALHGCRTHAKSLDMQMKRSREVIEIYIEADEEVDDSLEFVGIQQVSV